MTRTLLVAAALAASLAGAARADTPTYVPLGGYGDVTIQPTYAGVFGLTIKTPQWSYGALSTQDYQGNVGTTINNTGQVWIHPDYATQSPRLVISSPSYDCPQDPVQEIIGSSTVWSVTCGGEDESYNYYVGGDAMRFSVRNRDDSLQGGLDASGRYTTLAHGAPAPSDMQDGEARVWFNPTPVSGGLMVTMKFTDGSVKTTRLR